MYWISLVAGIDVAPGHVVNLGWVAGDIAPESLSLFARRNNFGGEAIESVNWSSGNSSSGLSLRVLGTPLPEPSTNTMFLLGIGLLFFAMLRRKKKVVV